MDETRLGEFSKIAVRHAKLSNCKKSQRGVVIVDCNNIIMGIGMNSSSTGCDDNELCRRLCAKKCIHAEQAAIIDALEEGETLETLVNSELIHVKAKQGELVPSGPPSCLECSKLILYCNIKTVWLYHETGWKSYDCLEFHQKTLEYIGI